MLRELTNTHTQAKQTVCDDNAKERVVWLELECSFPVCIIFILVEIRAICCGYSRDPRCKNVKMHDARIFSLSLLQCEARRGV